MGQRLLARARKRIDSKSPVPAAREPVCLSIFDTELGWFGLMGCGDAVQRIFLGHLSAEQVRRAAASTLATVGVEEPPNENDWNPKLRRALQDFARGIPTHFAEVKLDLAESTPFRKRVLEQTRKIAYGQRLTYGELAARAGKPGAARAVGSVMASNPLPIVIPCHRVVASGGALGGFSAPQGIELKRRLLEMEATSR
jgi:methylated-DNA-[protein]-cysteine S-methyltransferase